jgi:trk system potassium uptake protein TrkH
VKRRFESLRRVLGYLGAIHFFLGFVFVIPVFCVILFPSIPMKTAQVFSFVIPAVFTLALGLALRRAFGASPPASAREAVLVCVLGWLGVSAVGAIPFVLQGTAFSLDIGYLDAYFETMSGFTTTGITMFSGLDDMAPSLLLWRSFIQWLGGLGILAFFLVFVFSGSTAHRIFTAESHKVLSRRPVPGLFGTLKILWVIYCIFTGACVLMLLAGGMSLFDAVCHSFTALSTGGYSTHDASVAFYDSAFIDYTLVVFMLVGGINFLVHFRLLRGDLRALYDSFEIKLLWVILGGATAIILFEHVRANPDDSIASGFRYSIFQTTSILTTTGFGTKDIAGSYFGSAARLIFLSLMVVGGCIGSTGGGVKVLRVGVLLKMLRRQVLKIVYPGRVIVPLTLDGTSVDHEELRRVSALFFAWILLLFAGGLITALFSNLGPVESLSGMFSALGNIGPCYISAADMAVLNPAVKITYILGMLAGRLEILPVLLLFSRKAWS